MGLQADYLQDVAEELVPLYAQLQTDILEDVARRIAKTGRITDTADWQMRKMREAGIVNRDATRRIARLSGETQRTIASVFDQACTKAIAADDAIYKAAGLKLTPISASQSFRQIMLAGVDKTKGLFQNFTLTTANSAGQIYTTVMDRAYMQVTSGAFSFDEALRRAIKSLARDSITSLTYDKSGAVSTAEAAARRSLLTGLNQTTAQLQLERARQLDSDLVEVTAHLGARPSHAEWQGGIYSLSGKHRHYKNFYDETGYGSGDGLCGWNCYHSFFPFFEGLSKPTFSEMRSPTGKTNDQLYEESQIQRALERAIRASKREVTVLDTARNSSHDAELMDYLDSEFRRASVTLKARRLRLEEFLEETGRRADPIRILTPDFSRSTSSKAAWAARKAANQ